MQILAIDPGNEKSAWLIYDTEIQRPLAFAIEENDIILGRMQDIALRGFDHKVESFAIEMIASYGMAVGKTVFDTCVWIGRFIQAMQQHGRDHRFVYRKDEKMLLCGSMKAKDANIRQAIMDRYGSTREAAIGTKKKPGPLYGMSKDIWAAMAVALVAAETEAE